MGYNSKYTGEQVEELLDQVSSGGGGGGITSEDVFEGEAEDAEETLFQTALRKTKQTLTEAEKSQARTNIGAMAMEDLNALPKIVYDEATQNLSITISRDVPSMPSFSFDAATQTLTITT